MTHTQRKTSKKKFYDTTLIEYFFGLLIADYRSIPKIVFNPLENQTIHLFDACRTYIENIPLTEEVHFLPEETFRTLDEKLHIATQAVDRLTPHHKTYRTVMVNYLEKLKTHSALVKEKREKGPKPIIPPMARDSMAHCLPIYRG